MKQLHVLIKKNDQEYHIPFTPEETETSSLEEAYYWAVEVATGQANVETDKEILDLGTNREYEHIRVWYEGEDAPIVEPPKEPEAPRDYFERGKVLISYFLGNKLCVSGLEARYLGRMYFLPMAINDRPALEALDGNKLHALLITILPAYVAAIVPPAQLPDYDEAEEYIKDLGDERQKELWDTQEVKNKNAKAYFGFSEQ